MPRTIRVPILEEHVRVGRRRQVVGRARVRVRTHDVPEPIDVDLLREDVEIERVRIDRPVDAPLPTREEGDTLVIPVVEEVLVVERRLVLREEIRIRRRFSSRRHREVVRRRVEEAFIETPDSTFADGDEP